MGGFFLVFWSSKLDKSQVYKAGFIYYLHWFAVIVSCIVLIISFTPLRSEFSISIFSQEFSNPPMWLLVLISVFVGTVYGIPLLYFKRIDDQQAFNGESSSAL